MKVLSTLNFGSFPGKVMFSCGYLFDEVMKELKKQKCNEWATAFNSCRDLSDQGTAGFAAQRRLVIKGNSYVYSFIFIRDEFDYSPKHHATLSHEVIHACTFHLSDMIDIVKENEAFAYTHTHILNQCYDILGEQKLKNKRRK